MTRPALYHPRFIETYGNALRTARDDLAAMHERHLSELQSLRAEVAELRSILADVARVSREKAEGDVALMRRELAIALARLERNPTTRLQ